MQQEGRGGYACAARKFGAPLRAFTGYLVVVSVLHILTEKNPFSLNNNRSLKKNLEKFCNNHNVCRLRVRECSTYIFSIRDLKERQKKFLILADFLKKVSVSART